jgi:hypothetical protein
MMMTTPPEQYRRIIIDDTALLNWKRRLIFCDLGGYPRGRDTPLCGLGSGSCDTDRFGLAKGRDNLEYEQLVRTKDVKE